ncbi:MAG TPA: ABC transporter permease [Chloroflexota bacterium]|nr:ABC transporter permease [Chloroflexota bacterium]
MRGLIQESVIPEESLLLDGSEARGRQGPARALAWLRANLLTGFGLALLLVFFGAGLIGPWLETHQPDTLYPLSVLQAPGGGFPLGTDDLGRDLLSRILSGIRVSLSIGVGAIAVSLAVGAGIGSLAGYFGGWFDALAMRVMDVLVAFPAILLAIALMTMLGGSLVNVGLAIAIIYVPIFARIMRASVLTVRREQYVEAAESLGAGHARILIRHVVPNSASPILVQISLAISDAILIEAALSYLGLGVNPPTPSLGGLLIEGQGFMTTQPWMVIYPGLALTLGVFGFNLVGDSLRDLLDPCRRRR